MSVLLLTLHAVPGWIPLGKLRPICIQHQKTSNLFDNRCLLISSDHLLYSIGWFLSPWFMAQNHHANWVVILLLYIFLFICCTWIFSEVQLLREKCWPKHFEITKIYGTDEIELNGFQVTAREPLPLNLCCCSNVAIRVLTWTPSQWDQTSNPA